MNTIRPLLSAFLLVLISLISDGMVVSIHWCGGSIESFKLYSTQSSCCCDDEPVLCTLDQPDDCCWSVSTLLLYPSQSTVAQKFSIASAPPILLPTAIASHAQNIVPTFRAQRSYRPFYLVHYRHSINNCCYSYPRQICERLTSVIPQGEDLLVSTYIS